MFPGLRVRGSLEAGIVGWEQRYGPSATSGDLCARPRADMAEKCLSYSLSPPGHIFKIRCVNDKVLMKCERGRKDPGRPHLPVPAVSSGVQSSSTHTTVLYEEDRLSAHSYAWGAIFSTLYHYFFNEAREAFAFLLFNMSVLPFKHGPVYHRPCRNPVVF